MKDFLNMSKKTFRVVPKSYANYLSTSAQYTTDQVAKSKFEEDLKYLNNIYDFDGDERIGTVEAFDKALSSSARKKKTTEGRKQCTCG